MVNLTNTELLDLYLDESGYNYIGQAKYRFFLLSATIINNKDKELANFLFMKWRQKHLRDPLRCFHASEFFEDRAGKVFKRKELAIPRNFNNSVKELIELISYINFTSTVYYVDLPKLRSKLKLAEPPSEPALNNLQSKKEYSRLKNTYSLKIKDSLGEDKRYLPLSLTLNRSFDFHNNTLKPEEKGYLNIESQSNSDVKFIKIFHSFKDRIPNKVYDKKIVGINLHTKSSLDAGIELSDLITYIACQTLRFKFRLNDELKDIPNTRILIIKNVRSFLREKNVEIINVTEDKYKKS